MPADPAEPAEPASDSRPSTTPAGQSSSSLLVLALVRDLMFSSRITSAARQVGAAVKVVRDPAALAGEPGRLVVLDLNQPGTLEAAVDWKQRNPAGRAVGFVSHVDTETIARARDAGIDRVVSRGQLAQALPDLLR